MEESQYANVIIVDTMQEKENKYSNADTETEQKERETLNEDNEVKENSSDELAVSNQSDEKVPSEATSSLWTDPPDNQIIYPIWAFGFNQNIPVINLSRKSTNVVMYASAHLVIILDIDGQKQRILRGHCNEVTCLTANLEKRWLASGDSGPDSAVIIWDGNTGDAVRTMLSPHKNGVVSLELTEDARYLATLSADTVDQEFAIWNWTTGSEKPLCTVLLQGEHVLQNFIRFKPGNYYYVGTNSSSQVIFYHWNVSGEIDAYAPPLNDKDFDKKVGSFVGSSFIPETNTAVTATTQGLLVVWENDKPGAQKETLESNVKKAIKLVPVHDKPITFLTITRSRTSKFCIVTGDAAGLIKFFDTNFMLLHWYQNLNAGPIASVSFAMRKVLEESEKLGWRSSAILESTDYPRCTTIPGERFVIEDFIVTTAYSNMLRVTVDGGLLKYIFRENHEDVTGLSAHPSMPYLATCSLTGNVKIFNYENKMVISMRAFGENDPVKTCRYSPNGLYLGVGFVSGWVRILDSLTLKDVTSEPFKVGRGAITHIDFGPFNNYCAYADSAFTTTLLRTRDYEKEEPWIYVGRVRVHYRPINDLKFWLTPGTKTTRLFTVGQDQTLAEYDLFHSRENYFPLLSRHRVEQMSVPMCISSLPPHYKEDFIFMSTTASKFKLIHSSSFMNRKIVMAIPQAILYHKVKPLPCEPDATAHFIVCMSEERLALVMLPLDGDPLKTTNLIAHPSDPRGHGRASALAVSYDGKYAFTAGGPDSNVHMWKLTPSILEERVKNAPEVKRRFYELIDPELLHELKDYYYYSMLRTQGIQCLDTRKTSLTIPVSEISFVMRAIGFYPTEEEIKHMINEVKYSKFAVTGSYVNDIDLDTFIQMYCNYRPIQGTTYSELESAFSYLCHVRDSDTGKSLYFRDPRELAPSKVKIPPEYLFTYIQTIGEPIEDAELVDYLAILLGNFPEGGRPEATEPIDDEAISKEIDESLPMFLNVPKFMHRILGLKHCRNELTKEDIYRCSKLQMNVADGTAKETPDENMNRVSSDTQTD